jgi:hypothetical protein
VDIGYSWLPYVVAEALSYGMAGGAGYLAWRFVRAYERRCTDPERLEGLADRVHVLEEAVEQVAGRVEQTAEAQRFTTQLLLGREADRRQ